MTDSKGYSRSINRAFRFLVTSLALLVSPCPATAVQTPRTTLVFAGSGPMP